MDFSSGNSAEYVDAAPAAEKRVKERYAVRLRVDARLVPDEERDAIFAGMGFVELDNEALSLSRPRHGLARLETHDISASGLRVELGPLGTVGIGRSLCLDVHLPNDRRVVKLLGDVVWVGEQQGNPVAGLRMAALDFEGLERLMDALK